MSKNAGKSEMKEANELMRDNVAKLEALNIPTIEAQKIALETPELIEPLIAEMMGQSAMEDVRVDPRLQAAQYDVLSKLAERGELGFSPEDLAQFNAANRQAGGTAMAGIASGERRLAEKGMLDSGMTIQNMQASAQAAADRQNQANIATAAEGARARREALAQESNLAAQMMASDLGLKTGKASATDVINQFNTQNRQQVAGANKAYQVGRAGDIANIHNQEQTHNKALIPAQFQQQVQKAGGVAQAQSALANQYQSQAGAAQQAQQAQNAAIMNVAGTAAGMGFQANQNAADRQAYATKKG